MVRARCVIAWSLVMLAFGPASARAQWTAIAPGVEYLARTDPGPNRVRALRINLCASGVRVRATATGERGQVTSRWGESVGVVAAINGGYFLSGYRPDGGRAAGAGAEWPDSTDTNYRGTFAFGRGQTAHSEAPAVEALPPWAEEAVNGDATLVHGGGAVNCGGCGGGRAPRTAAGITADRRTLYLVTVDGRSTSSVGMTIDQLAVLMAGFGVDRAMNLDGGGSTTMWIAGRGVVNVPSDGAQRTVSNHLGIYARGGGPAYNCPTGYSAQHTGSEFAGGTIIPVEVGTTVRGALTFRNTGTEPWSGRTRLAPTPRDVASPLAAPSWMSPTRIASPDADVPPGAIGRFPFELSAPTTPGMYRMTFSLVEEGVIWFADSWGPADDVFWIRVDATPPPDFRAEILQVEGVPAEGPLVLERGEVADVTIEVRNTGSAVWSAELVRIGTTGERDRDSVFSTAEWINGHRAVSNDVEVAVGGVHRFSFALQAPETLGEHVETFGLVAEGRAWFGDRGGPADDALRFAITVVERRPDAGLAGVDGGRTPASDGGGMSDGGGAPRLDAGAGSELVGGCACRAGSSRGSSSAPSVAWIALAIAALARRRHRR